MARKNKPVKIKRYKNSMGTSSQSVAAAKRLIPFVLAAVLVVAIGFFLGKPVLNFISGIGKDDPESQVVSSQPQETPAPEQTPAPTPQQSTQQPDSSEEIQQPAVPPVAETDKTYYYVNTANIANEAGLSAAIAAAKNAGATHLVFDVKNRDGYLHYASANRYGSQLKADTQLDLAALADRLKAAGLTPVARIYTFMDKMISTVERSTAVMYQGTETRWLDTSAALGGKAWANPASKIMQDYILAITDEILAAGIKEFVFAGFHTPTGYSLDKRDFGASTDQVLANMQSLFGTLEAKISAKGGTAALQVEYSAVMPEGSYAQYIVHPYQLGAEELIVTARGGETDVAAAVAALSAAEDTEEISSITLWLTDNVNTEQTKTLGDYFVF
ncbi:MAG: hypothetical protein II977_03500 [Oscillospiraceae bacterium]|nr:hypothetical protein [Oscillospiraceae bacterium]